jgi:hypothetical protein
MTLPRNQSPGAIIAPGDSGITQSAASTTLTQSAASTALIQYVTNGHMSIGSILPTWVSSTHDSIAPEVHNVSPSDPIHDRLRRIEQMLGIANRDLTLEAEFSELEALGNKMDDVLDAASVLAPVVRKASAQYTSFVDECNTMKKLELNNDPDD